MHRTGRRPGTSTTRDEIVSAAAAAFTASGYEAVSVRKVAADAGVDPALVRRFYGGKEQLFTAVVTSVFQPEQAVAMLLDGPRGKLGERLAAYVLDLLGDVRQPGPLLGLMRSAATNDHAAALIRQFLANDMLGKLTQQLGVDQPQLRAALAAGHLVGIAIARYAVRVDALVAAEPDELIAWIAPALQRYLTGRAPARPA
ncbi:TetR/AcrR family transcriptional regulator [Nonomuraea sp. FMUSA5-5]|uniref:TetR/AcrR family transcriptional regulator n=1 Tax=Nonomuraea composti TaxID=2720023 RepID=A0ABX1BE02_9ACTN|nr:TetR family transcriptional regulator [Nonomuraea sp. FMUSA5-5]NJP96008.1 TetR/AcrR family transcriptional regulator [Nonomuraea sp. FMUSA5-5]